MLQRVDNDLIIVFSCSIGSVCIELSLTNGATSPVPFVFIMLPTTTFLMSYFLITSIYLSISLNVILYKNMISNYYNIKVSKKPYTALCVDVFSEEDGLVILSDRSWMTDKGKYNSISGEFTPFVENISEDYVSKINTIVYQKFTMSSLLLSTKNGSYIDYYARLGL